MTGVVGLKWKPSGNFELGGGFEFPMTRTKTYSEIGHTPT